MFHVGVANDVCVFGHRAAGVGAWCDPLSHLSIFKNQTRPRADRDGVPQSLSKPDTTAETQITPNQHTLRHRHRVVFLDDFGTSNRAYSNHTQDVTLHDHTRRARGGCTAPTPTNKGRGT